MLCTTGPRQSEWKSIIWLNIEMFFLLLFICSSDSQWLTRRLSQFVAVFVCRIHNQSLAAWLYTKMTCLHRRNDLSSFERQCTSVSVVILHPCHWRTIPTETPVCFLQPTCCPAVQPFHRRKTGFSSFRRQLLEQSSVTVTLHLHRRSRYSDSVLRHFSFTCHIRTWFSDFLLLHCGPGDNFVI